MPSLIKVKKWAIVKTVHRVIKFNQKALLISYIDMSANSRKAAKNDFEKDYK